MVYKVDEAARKLVRKEMWAEMYRFLRVVVVGIAVAMFVSFGLIANTEVPTGSMNNTIMDGERVIAWRPAYMFEEPKRFDIVLFEYPRDKQVHFVKRVIGMPGETVRIRDGKVYIDGSDTPLRDDFVMLGATGNFGPYFVPEGHYFMMGDNRDNSIDSRFWWRDTKYIAKDEIIGEIIFSYYPGFKVLAGR